MSNRRTLLETTLIILALSLSAWANEKPADDPWGPPEDGPRRVEKPHDNQEHSGRFRRGRGPLTEERIEEYKQILLDVRPDLAERLEKLDVDRPEAFRRFLRTAPWLFRLRHVKQIDEPRYALMVEDLKLAHRSRETAQAYRAAREGNDKAKADELQAELRELVAQHFDVRQQLRERELAYLEQRLQELREQLKDREAKKQQLIDQRLKELATRRDRPEW
jgi:chromosome segregation ATPase